MNQDISILTVLLPTIDRRRHGQRDRLNHTSSEKLVISETAVAMQEAKITMDASADTHELRSELEAAYSGAQTFLPYMAGVSAIALPVSLRIPYTWAAQMETAGFTNWPPLPLVHFQSAVFTVVILTGAYATLAMPSVMPPASSRRLKAYAVVITTTMLLIWIGFASFFVDMCPAKAAVGVVGPQIDAVASYNRGYCEAWCRADPAGLSALSRGECGSLEKAIYDSVVAVDDVREWCQAAIATKNFELDAPHNGASPFAGLKGRDGCRVTDNAFTIPIAMLNLFATLFLYEFSITYWRMTLPNVETTRANPKHA